MYSNQQAPTDARKDEIELDDIIHNLINIYNIILNVTQLEKSTRRQSANMFRKYIYHDNVALAWQDFGWSLIVVERDTQKDNWHDINSLW